MTDPRITPEALNAAWVSLGGDGAKKREAAELLAFIDRPSPAASVPSGEFDDLFGPCLHGNKLNSCTICEGRSAIEVYASVAAERDRLKERVVELEREVELRSAQTQWLAQAIQGGPALDQPDPRWHPATSDALGIRRDLVEVADKLREERARVEKGRELARRIGDGVSQCVRSNCAVSIDWLRPLVSQLHESLQPTTPRGSIPKIHDATPSDLSAQREGWALGEVAIELLKTTAGPAGSAKAGPEQASQSDDVGSGSGKPTESGRSKPDCHADTPPDQPATWCAVCGAFSAFGSPWVYPKLYFRSSRWEAGEAKKPEPDAARAATDAGIASARDGRTVDLGRFDEHAADDALDESAFTPVKHVPGVGLVDDATLGESVEHPGCYDCSRPYGDEYGFSDLVIPNEQWREISPTGNDGGLLCPSCILARLAKAGKRGVYGALMSGPIRSVDEPTMHAIRWTENLRENEERRAAETKPEPDSAQGRRLDEAARWLGIHSHRYSPGGLAIVLDTIVEYLREERATRP